MTSSSEYTQHPPVFIHCEAAYVAALRFIACANTRKSEWRLAMRLQVHEQWRSPEHQPAVCRHPGRRTFSIVSFARTVRRYDPISCGTDLSCPNAGGEGARTSTNAHCYKYTTRLTKSQKRFAPRAESPNKRSELFNGKHNQNNSLKRSTDSIPKKRSEPMPEHRCLRGAS